MTTSRKLFAVFFITIMGIAAVAATWLDGGPPVSIAAVAAVAAFCLTFILWTIRHIDADR